MLLRSYEMPGTGSPLLIAITVNGTCVVYDVERARHPSAVYSGCNAAMYECGTWCFHQTHIMMISYLDKRSDARVVLTPVKRTPPTVPRTPSDFAFPIAKALNHTVTDTSHHP